MRSWSTVVLSLAFAGILVMFAVFFGAIAEAGGIGVDASPGRLSLSKRVADASAPIDPKKVRIAPDPPPLSERRQWIFDLRYDHGDVYLLGMHQVELAAAQATPRAMGRFALELYEGPTVIERARFDFPMLVAAGIDAGDAGRDRNRVDFDAKLVSRIGVMFPSTARGTRLELWDRGTDQRWSLPWPPTDTRKDASAP
ncbi:hypothetical protein LVJ94_44560 [Pendulispora rubella]|uniref:Uncharacterized protein n=1 Tax=Pendulispora rubella TaxID=2741070 RepID=A0ABZ2KZ61_9BACT